MTGAAFESIWPILALLAGALVFITLTVLAAQQRHALEQYNRIRASRVMRIKYLESLESRRTINE
jgi:hypothetical protein